MNIAVIGAKGIVGSALVQFYEELGHRVSGVDRDSGMTIEDAAASANAVFVATLPLEELSAVLNQAAAVMRAGSLLVNCASIESPVSNPVDAGALVAHGIAYCHAHLHFRPAIPLRETAKDNTVTLRFLGGDAEPWQDLLDAPFTATGMKVRYLASGEHDQITAASQVIHMAVAALIVGTKSQLPESAVRAAGEIGGPAYQLLAQSVDRTVSGAEVAGAILANHPHVLEVVDSLATVLAELRAAVEAGDADRIKALLTRA